jgi:thiamine pyrophosphate-dependent acetolactate synthase large subunit-like protein
MVDVIRALDVEYVALNPGSSFRGLHESLINHGGNHRPTVLTCLHEETSVGIAHGYARVTGRPMMALMHGAVGTQHAAMAIYNAFADRIPVLLMSASGADAANRRPFVEWVHSVQDGAALVRDFTKWDDQPASLQHFAESMARARQLAMSAPRAPVMITADTDLQEAPVAGEAPHPIRPRDVRPPVGDPAALDQVAAWLLGAERPLIIADRYANSPAGLPALVRLAEALGAPVVDQGGRMNFPTHHPLNQTSRLKALAATADVILALEPIDLHGALVRFREGAERTFQLLPQPSAKIVVLGVDPVLRSNYQDFMRYFPATLFVEGDAEASVPHLIEAVRRKAAPDFAAVRGARAAEAAAAWARTRVANVQAAAVGWDASPISTARLCMELWGLLKDEPDWTLASPTWSVSSWPQRLWDIGLSHQLLGSQGAAGIGTSIATALGAALANKALGRLTVNIQTDGDLMYAPGALWTAAHHRIPLLTVMHNNRAYHQEVMHVARIAARNGRPVEQVGVGNVIADPNIDFAALARSLGVWSAGPIQDPAALRPALTKALAEVKAGRPALVDVVCQPR